MRNPFAALLDSRLLGSLDRRDRKLLLGCLAAVAVMIVVIAVAAPRQRDESPVPSSFGTGVHGAKAAYLLLARSGYQVERWERPLSDLDAPKALPVIASDSVPGSVPGAAAQNASTTDENTVLILAEPFSIGDKQAKKEVQTILDHGGRVLATGWSGGQLLPGSQAEPNPGVSFDTVCHTQPEGLDLLAQSGAVEMGSPAIWKPERPQDRVQYRCGSGAVVVTYRAGKDNKGQVVWWADSTPLENGGVERANNLDLLLNTLGPPQNVRVVWDESLHGDVRTLWSYTSGTPVYLLWIQAGLVGALLLLSYSRRSGPLRPLADVTRRSPVEFVESLGALYDRAGASNTTVVIAYERFRHQLEKRIGFSAAEAQMGARQLAEAIQRRLHYNHPELTADLEASEAASNGEIKPRAALRLVQALHDHSVRLGLGPAAMSADLALRADVAAPKSKIGAKI